MRALLVIAAVVLALFLLGRLRLGAAVDSSEAGLILKLKLGPAYVGILPPKAKKGAEKKAKKKKPKKRPAKEKSDTQKKRSAQDTLSLALRFVPLLGQAAGRLKRKIRIDRLVLRVIWGAADPAGAAMAYGAGNAVLGILWPVFEHNFHVKEYDLRTCVDYGRKSPAVTAQAQVTMTLGQLFSLAVWLGIGALKILLGARREETKREAVQA